MSYIVDYTQMEGDMKKIGIVICNFNKKQYVLNCIKSIFEQTIDDFDIYVVDNASTDGSADAVKEEYGDKVTLLVNEENLGGSGGFNTGLRKVIEVGYEYLMCVDNDVVFDKDAINQLYLFLQTNPDVGMVGSKIFYMDNPDTIWSYGGEIDFKKYVQKDLYRNCVDNEDIPKSAYCTYVPACSLMVRKEVVEKVGIMPEDNFIYLDDMEWGYNVTHAGYKVAVCGESKVWHKCGGRNSVNTFNNYYMWRNRINFFLKTLSEENKEEFADYILDEMFRLVYSCNLKKDTGVVKTVMYAFNDVVNGIRGKAPEYKIFQRNRDANRLRDYIDNSKSVLIKFNNDFEGLGNIIKNILNQGDVIDISIYTESNSEELQKQYPNCSVVSMYEPEKYEKHLVMCEHIFKITSDMPQDVYIDSWCNIIYSEDDFVYARSFEQTKELFVMCKKGLLIDK